MLHYLKTLAVIAVAVVATGAQAHDEKLSELLRSCAESGLQKLAEWSEEFPDEKPNKVRIGVFWLQLYADNPARLLERLRPDQAIEHVMETCNLVDEIVEDLEKLRSSNPEAR